MMCLIKISTRLKTVYTTKVEKKDSKDRKYVVFIDSGVGISVDGDPEATDTHCG